MCSLPQGLLPITQLRLLRSELDGHWPNSLPNTPTQRSHTDVTLNMARPKGNSSPSLPNLDATISPSVHLSLTPHSHPVLPPANAAKLPLTALQSGPSLHPHRPTAPPPHRYLRPVMLKEPMRPQGTSDLNCLGTFLVVKHGDTFLTNHRVKVVGSMRDAFSSQPETQNWFPYKR